MTPWDPRTGSGRLAAVLEQRPADPPDDVREPPAVPVAAVPAGAVPRRRGRRAALANRWLPGAWRGARLDPGWPGALALLLVAVVAALLAAVGVWRAAPRPEPVAALPPLVTTTEPTAETAGGPGSSATSAPPEQLVVAVAGRVVRPGLVRVAAGARVADVLDAAGGPLPGTDLNGVNLARRVSDGEQVAVGVPAAPDAVPNGAVSGAAAGGAAADGQPGGLLDLNTATVEQLDGLPGVGPVTAQRIVEWRTRNGRFASLDQLREVEGIGERRFAQLRGLVRV